MQVAQIRALIRENHYLEETHKEKALSDVTGTIKLNPELVNFSATASDCEQKYFTNMIQKQKDGKDGNCCDRRGTRRPIKDRKSNKITD